MQFIRWTPWIFLTLVLIGCNRSSYDVWEDTKSCGRYVNRGFKTLCGNSRDSRAVRCKEDFYCMQSYGEEEFIPLQDECREGRLSAVDMQIPQPAQSPGDPGSPIPGIQSFRDPSLIPQLAGIFRNVHFEYNQHVVKGEENVQIVRGVAAYLRQHPQTCIFIEGHCDERGPEAYNLALGTRRANAVRMLLVQEGANPDHIFTISFGKERPLFLDHHEEAWGKNRRAEFKIYQR